MSLAVAIPTESILKPYGRKAYNFAFRPVTKDKRNTILHGAVRSAKTWTMLPKLLQLCEYKVQGWRVITGVSKNTIHNNVLNDLFSLVGTDNYTYNRQTGNLQLFDSQWLVIGAKDEGSEKYVRGLTVGVAYGDELVLLPPGFLGMLLNRMSPEGARFYGTTNPDTPFHYVKVELIDNEAMRDNGSIEDIHFELDDNPNLSEEYKRHLRALYPQGSLFRKRFVDGLWVTGEGSIYKDCWNDDLYYASGEQPKYLYDPTGHVDEFVPVDCGVDHPQVYLDFVDDGKVLWVDHEYWWDSSEMLRQKTDREYKDDLAAFMKLNGRPNAQVLLPPECASFDAELTQAGIWHIDSDNEVLDGIKAVAGMMALKRLRFRVEKKCRGRKECICGTRCCVRTVAQLHTYVWDPKARLRGVEQPLKQKDDGPDAVRYGVKTKIQDWRLAAA